MIEAQYKAFISYSHAERRWAEWLHRALESYRVPKRLQGLDGKHGPVPARLRPVFMDREELGAAHSLDRELRQALEASEFLLVLCSPDAARSRWIDEEIRLFTELGRRERILALIIDGDPEAHSGPDACFPESLMRDPDGLVHEPLAADARPHADGKRLALLKVIAGLLGVPLDTLRRREHQRTVRRRTALGAALLAVLTVAAFSLVSWNTSVQRRDSGETLVAMKLNELRSVLAVEEDPMAFGRLAGFADEDRNWGTAQLAGGRAQAERRALALVQEEGIPAWEAGDLDTALAHFRRAWLLDALLLRDDPADREAFFRLGQDEFWIGQVLFDRGEFERANRAFTAYAEITRRLIQSEPDNPEWVLEMAYALTNLGALELETGGDPDRILQVMQSALEYNQIALVLDPGNRLYAAELGQSLVNLSTAQLRVCDIDGALETTQASVEHEQAIFERREGGYDHHKDLASALGSRASIHASRGEAGLASIDLSRSLELLKEMQAARPGDSELAALIFDRHSRLLRAQGLSGGAEKALAGLEGHLPAWEAWLASPAAPGLLAYSDLIATWLTQAELLIMLDRRTEALAAVDAALDTAIDVRAQAPAIARFDALLVKAAFLAWHLGAPAERPDVEALLKTPGTRSENRSCRDALKGLQIALMTGRSGESTWYADYLAARGYRDPSYAFVCRHYSVCDAP